MTPPPLSPAQSVEMRRTTFTALTTLFIVTALLAGFVSLQFSRRGHWLPQLPGDFQQWSVTERLLNHSDLETLGFPPASGYNYMNLFGETVEVMVTAASSFDCYLDPPTIMRPYGLGMTAQKEMPLFGADGPVNAMVFRNAKTDRRVMVYYWVQDTSGKTSATKTLPQNNDFFARARLGMEALVDVRENCVVRAYSTILPSDRDGIQTRRNLDEICQMLHQTLKEQGEKRRGR